MNTNLNRKRINRIMQTIVTLQDAVEAAVTRAAADRAEIATLTAEIATLKATEAAGLVVPDSIIADLATIAPATTPEVTPTPSA